MTELLDTSKELDSYVRDQVETVLIGKGTNSQRSLHIPSENDSTEVACKAQTERVEGWRPKPIDVYPQGYFEICPWCAERRFGVEVIDDG